MRCSSKEIDIEVIIKRITNFELNLQPSFQRGEVWSISKKKRLIDSILRGWKIPPIHVISSEGDFAEEVLDGQQRLVAISEFAKNGFKVDGNIMPINPSIQDLDNLSYDDLPSKVRWEFNRYALTIITLDNFYPEEPAELFYRLNQPATLTSAEQRNAYISPSRNQIKDLVSHFQKCNARTETIGFSNSRLAYDEVISKFAYLLEINTLRKKITSNDMSEKYRSDIPFSENIINDCSNTITNLMAAITENSSIKLKLNKATLFSWMIFVFHNAKILPQHYLSEIIYCFEYFRQSVKKVKLVTDKEKLKLLSNLKEKYFFLEGMLLIFNQRSSMGSTDALSIIYRDIILNIFMDMYLNHQTDLLNFALQNYAETSNFNSTLEAVYHKFNWGNKSI